MLASKYKWIDVAPSAHNSMEYDDSQPECSTRRMNSASWEGGYSAVTPPSIAHNSAEIVDLAILDNDDDVFEHDHQYSVAESIKAEQIEHDVIPSPSTNSLDSECYDTVPSPSTSDSEWAEWACDEQDKDTIRLYQKIKTNLVLESLDYRLAPHIVITPSEDLWDDYYTPWRNGVDPQWVECLCIPPSDVAATTSLPPVETSYIETLSTPTPIASAEGETPSPKLKQVFSHGRFRRSVAKASNERLMMYHVVTALQRRSCKAVAHAVSSIAKIFRTRYDVPAFCAALEKPFVWSDPAVPLLESSRYHLGTLVLDSLCPFIAPHIIVNAPPPENPWIPFMNATNDPQDCGYGRYLTVPTSFVGQINTADEDEEYTYYYAHELEAPQSEDLDFDAMEREDEYDGEDFDDDDFVSGMDDDDTSTTDSSAPETPSDLCEVDIPFSFPMPPQGLPVCSSYSSTSSKVLFMDDDEEDLPDLDDPFYRDIIQRTTV